ncbi:MAG: WbqC family protein [Candidatus Stahlbacteria bacterium]|nr:WbqC family protein [Candidatus Stahlbacteria bacterium]
MICAIHQPQYLPYLGFFDKIRQADVFVLLDNCQFKKNEWQNRNRIRDKEGWQWLTVPVIQRFGQSINEVKINNTLNWRHKHIQAILLNYPQSPKHRKEFFRNSLDREWNYLVDINIHFIIYLMDAFEINTKMIRASEEVHLMDIHSQATDRLIEICEKMGADTYLSGPGGKEYLEVEKFKHIKLKFQEFNHPTYTQQFKGFIPFLSSIDYLFNCGGKI